MGQLFRASPVSLSPGGASLSFVASTCGITRTSRSWCPGRADVVAVREAAGSSSIFGAARLRPRSGRVGRRRDPDGDRHVPVPRRASSGGRASVSRPAGQDRRIRNNTAPASAAGHTELGHRIWASAPDNPLQSPELGRYVTAVGQPNRRVPAREVPCRHVLPSKKQLVRTRVRNKPLHASDSTKGR